MRFRFTSPHPKDFPTELLKLIANRPNLCKCLHIPAQSGSSSVLERMRRGYTREAYLNLIDEIQSIIPGCALTSDFISGFCGETEDEHQATISLLERVKYDNAFMFAYSLREKTHAHRNYEDDVKPEDKARRLKEVIETFHRIAKEKIIETNALQVVLVEGKSRRSGLDLCGRTDSNKIAFFPDIPIPADISKDSPKSQIKPGDYVILNIHSASTQSMKGTPLGITTLSNSSLHLSHYAKIPSCNDRT